jgi:hypothetical protein
MTLIRYPLTAEVFFRESTQEWVLDISGQINETHVSVCHTQPGYLMPELVPHLAENDLSRMDPPEQMAFAFYLVAKFDIFRLLICNTPGQMDAAEHVERHVSICEKFVALTQSIDTAKAASFQKTDEIRKVRETYDSREISGHTLYEFVLEQTRNLTENLGQIGITEDTVEPNYQKIERLFSEEFYKLGCKAVDMWVWAEPNSSETLLSEAS